MPREPYLSVLKPHCADDFYGTAKQAAEKISLQGYGFQSLRGPHCVVPLGLDLRENPTRHSRAGLQIVPSLRD